jgi:hypothetical protein
MNALENGHGAELREIREHTRVMLQPIAAPSILGLFGFAGARSRSSSPCPSLPSAAAC